MDKNEKIEKLFQKFLTLESEISSKEEEEKWEDIDYEASELVVEKIANTLGYSFEAGEVWYFTKHKITIGMTLDGGRGGRLPIDIFVECDGVDVESLPTIWDDIPKAFSEVIKLLKKYNEVRC